MNRLAALCLGLIVAGCAGYSVPPQTTPSPTGTGRPTSAPASSTSPGPAATGPQAEIEILISGGPHDGSYRAVANGACDYAPAQNKFTVTYADNTAADGFVALDLVLDDAALAKTDESDYFTAKISVGGANGGISYSLEPKNGEGSGSAFLDTSPTDATLDLEVAARDGATIELTVICGLAGS